MTNGPSGTEWGAQRQALEEARHDIKNLRHAIEGVTELLREVDREVSRLRADFEGLRGRIYTALAVAVAAISVMAWAVEIFFK